MLGVGSGICLTRDSNMRIEVEKLSHTLPPIKMLGSYGINSLSHQREFDSEHEILDHFTTADSSRIVKTSSPPRFTTEVVSFFIVSYVGTGDTVFSRERVSIPAYFTFDGESIGWLQKYNSRGSRIAALVHDWLYYYQEHHKWLCDEVMYQIQIQRGVSKLTAKTVRAGLKYFGQSSYDAYKKK